jgi:NTP pyrophosphatase (non-canonical NTP hydrolase)
MPDIADYHDEIAAEFFPSWCNEDEHFLALALCGEAGELANMIKKRWRDGTDLTEEVKDELADIFIYHAMLARLFGMNSEQLYARSVQKLQRVVLKRKAMQNG